VGAAGPHGRRRRRLSRRGGGLWHTPDGPCGTLRTAPVVGPVHLFRVPGPPPVLRLFELLGRQVQALGVPRAAHFTVASTLLGYVMGVAAQNAANTPRVRPGAHLDATATAWEQLDPERYGDPREDEVHPGEELRPVVVRAQLPDDGPGERRAARIGAPACGGAGVGVVKRSFTQFPRGPPIDEQAANSLSLTLTRHGLRASC
jgi:hypothetical protein